MENTSSNSKRIAKNTIYLYFRMLLTMGVALYTSRVILAKLGVIDYGLYNVVGGIVGMLTFVNGTLSIGTSRFITYEIGTGNLQKLKKTFNTSFYTHLALAIILLLILESIGLWFLYNKIVIPPDRFNACLYVYQLSILTAFVSVTQVPYNALVQSHECFDVYAYISIFEAFAKLFICYLITITSYDKLVIYSILVVVIQIIVASFYRCYCTKKFSEAKLSLSFDHEIFKKLIGFSGWNLVANLCVTLRLQGIIIIINLFLSPVVVAAQAISNQVSNALMLFVDNFRTAFNPQIIKLYASGAKDESKKLTLDTTYICFCMVSVLTLPCLFTMKTIMNLWLEEVPEYAIIFTQFVLFTNIIRTFDASFYIPMMAANKIKFNSVCSFITGIIQYVILFVALYRGGGALWIPILSFVIAAIFAFVVKPYVLCKDVNYTSSELALCYWNCAKMFIFSIIVPILLLCFMEENLTNSVLTFILTFLSVILSSLCFMERQMRNQLFTFIKSKINRIIC